jgi:hypothetical protein
MMGYGLLWIGLLWLFLLLGFAYIIWAQSLKETGLVKTAGQVIAGVIALLTLVIFLVGAVKGGEMKRGMMGGSCPMMGSGMMKGDGGCSMKGGKDGMKSMDKSMMKDMMKEHHKGMK